MTKFSRIKIPVNLKISGIFLPVSEMAGTQGSINYNSNGTNGTNVPGENE